MCAPSRTRPATAAKGVGTTLRDRIELEDLILSRFLGLCVGWHSQRLIEFRMIQDGRAGDRILKFISLFPSGASGCVHLYYRNRDSGLAGKERSRVWAIGSFVFGQI